MVINKVSAIVVHFGPVTQYVCPPYTCISVEKKGWVLQKGR